MTVRQNRGNILTGGIARLVSGVGSGVLDAFLDVAARAGSNWSKTEPGRPPRPARWWETPPPRSKRRR